MVAERGFDGVTYREVGREAGMTHQLVTYHFGSLEALFHEAAELASQDAIKGASLTPPDGHLERFLDKLIDSANRDQAAHVFQYEMALRSRHDENLARESRTLYEEYFRIIGDALPQMGLSNVTPAFARVLFAAIDGLMLQHFVFSDTDRTEESVEALREVLRTLAQDDT